MLTRVEKRALKHNLKFYAEEFEKLNSTLKKFESLVVPRMPESGNFSLRFKASLLEFKKESRNILLTVRRAIENVRSECMQQDKAILERFRQAVNNNLSNTLEILISQRYLSSYVVRQALVIAAEKGDAGLMRQILLARPGLASERFCLTRMFVHAVKNCNMDVIRVLQTNFNLGIIFREDLEPLFIDMIFEQNIRGLNILRDKNTGQEHLGSVRK